MLYNHNKLISYPKHPRYINDYTTLEFSIKKLEKLAEITDRYTKEYKGTNMVTFKDPVSLTDANTTLNHINKLLTTYIIEGDTLTFESDLSNQLKKDKRLIEKNRRELKEDLKIAISNEQCTDEIENKIKIKKKN